MKTVFVLLVCASALFAQIPTPKGDFSTQSVPVLQEWWRADNMGYGIPYNGGNGGMTWLDNFYNGKGALVISTPTGVKTWQLRFPGDTVNVFIWQGSAPWGDYKSPNPIIKTIDINGDKITDYIDGVGNLYIGIKNGEPPNPKPSFYGLTPVFISDINNDTYDDALSWNISSSQDSIIAYILYGAKEANNITIDSVKLPTELYSNTDRTVQPINIYKTPNGEIRIILRYRIMGKEDGYKLYGFTKTQNNYVFELKDSYIASTTNDYSYQGYNVILHSNLRNETYFAVFETINGDINNSYLSVYNITNDKIESLKRTNFQRVTGIGKLEGLANADNFPDFYVRFKPTGDSAQSNVQLCRGNELPSITPISQFNILSMQNIKVISDVDNDDKKDIICTGSWFDQQDVIKLFSFGKAVSVNTNTDSVTNPKLIILNPEPIRESLELNIKLIISSQANSRLELFDIEGKKIKLLWNGVINSEQIVIADLKGLGLSAGTYFLSLANGKNVITKQFLLVKE